MDTFAHRWVEPAKTNCYEPGGTDYGFLYPGSTADMTVTLKNRGFSEFSDLNTLLECDDPYISVLDNAGYFGFLAPESTKENITDRFVISVDQMTPPGYTVSFRVIATESNYSDTFYFNFITDTLCYYAWDPVQGSNSGHTIDSLLTTLGYSGVCSSDLIHNPGNCQSLYVCTGIYDAYYYMSQWNIESITLANYLQEGQGCMYMEGDVWIASWQYQYDFGTLFGIEAAGGHFYIEVPVIGIPGTFTEGMNFGLDQYYTGNIVPIMAPSGSGYLIFKRPYAGGDGNCGIARITTAYRTVGATFEFGNLIDNSGASRRIVLLDSIMSFFAIHPGVQEYSPQDIQHVSLRASPIPCRDALHIEYCIPPATEARLRIFDISGRMIYSTIVKPEITHIHSWHLTDQDGHCVPNGIYVVQLETDKSTLTEKVILLR